MDDDPNGLLWASYERHLRLKKRSPRTIQGYQEAFDQLAAFHDGASVIDMDREHYEEYLLAVISQPKRRRRGAVPEQTSTALNRYRSLRAFTNWLVEEEYIEISPMARIPAPSSTSQPVPIVDDSDLVALLKACVGKDFEERRDTSIIRIWCEPGSPRVAEMAGLTLDGLDMKRDQVTVLGKGGRIRTIPFGAKTGVALQRYLMLRAKHPDARRFDNLWLGARGVPLTASGLYQMLERRCRQAEISFIHPHQLRHKSAHEWADAGGSEADAMVLFGWTSPEMPRVYGRAAAAERAQHAARRRSLGDRL